MIVVDTSVWIAAARKPSGPDATTLQSLIDFDEVALALPVRMELMAGIAKKDRRAFARGLSALPILAPTEETWVIAESWIQPAAEAGFRFAVTDLLIAAVTAEIGGLVWSLDDDFRHMEQLGFAKRYVEKGDG